MIDTSAIHARPAELGQGTRIIQPGVATLSEAHQQLGPTWLCAEHEEGWRMQAGVLVARTGDVVGLAAPGDDTIGDATDVARAPGAAA